MSHADRAEPGPGRGPPARPPARIVSLVPSLTEAVFALGLGSRVVGVTDWCVHPADAVRGLPRVGGTKTPDLRAVRALAPDLVLANREENRRSDVERLEAAGVPVWVTYPRTVRDAVLLLGELADALGALPEHRADVLTPVERALAEAEDAPPATPVSVFCPIWRDPWMVVGEDTYAYDLLVLCGGAPILAGTGDRRYPRVSLDAVAQAAPQVVLLPDEPYAFGPRDVAELQALPLPASASRRIHLIDGTLVSWYGPRIHRAIGKLRSLLRATEG